MNDALVYIEPHLTPRVRLGRNAAKVIVHRDGTVEVVSKQTFKPKYIYTTPDEKQPVSSFSRPFTIISGPNGSITGKSTITGKWFRIDTAPEYVAAARRQGIPIERPGLLGVVARMKRALAALGLCLLLTSCGGWTGQGVVTEKTHSEAYSYTHMICSAYSKGGTCTVWMPIMQHSPESWGFKVTDRDGNPHDVDVSRQRWEAARVGDKFDDGESK